MRRPAGPALGAGRTGRLDPPVRGPLCCRRSRRPAYLRHGLGGAHAGVLPSRGRGHCGDGSGRRRSLRPDKRRQPRPGADYQRGARSPQEPGRHAGNRGLAQGRHLQGRRRRHVRTAPAAGPATSTRRRGRRESTAGGSAAGRRRLSFAQHQPGRGGAGGHRHGSPLAHARGQARGRPGTSGRPLRTHARSAGRLPGWRPQP